MDTYLTEMESEIAGIESEMSDLQGRIAHTPGHNSRAELNRQLAALRAKHELLVRRVQHATVGAAKPGQVL